LGLTSRFKVHPRFSHGQLRIVVPTEPGWSSGLRTADNRRQRGARQKTDSNEEGKVDGSESSTRARGNERN